MWDVIVLRSHPDVHALDADFAVFDLSGAVYGGWGGSIEMTLAGRGEVGKGGVVLEIRGCDEQSGRWRVVVKDWWASVKGGRCL